MKPTAKRRAVKVRRRLRRGAYVLPSLFTMGNILLGFYAVVLAMRADEQPSNYAVAALLIFFAGFADTLDGRIARLTGTESDFGKEFDSLADVLTFGSTPALLAYHWALQPLGRLGWLLALFFLLCTAIRLARFNVQTKASDSRYFVGLPSPAAAGFIAGLIFIAHDDEARDAGLDPVWLEALMPFALVIIGSLMVSTFRYPSLKRVDLRQRLSYRAALVMATVVLVLVYYPEAFLPGMAFCYALLGPIGWILGRLRWYVGPGEKSRQDLETPKT